MQDLQLLAINLTEKCNMACAHCYLDAKTLKQGAASELGTDEVCELLSQLASRSTQTMVVLTGGEPLLRADLEEMIQHGSGLGLSMVIGTNGTALTERRVQSLKRAGLLGVGISVDSLQAEKHDQFRGLKGSWAKTMNGIEACRKHGLSFQIHFTVTRRNHHEIKAITEFSHEVGARVLNFFFLVCTGRGKSVQDIDADNYERVLKEIIETQSNYPEMIIRARCAPHFKRVAYQLNPQSKLNKISGMDGDGCTAGIHYARVSPTGTVTACPYIEQGVGTIREQDFWQLWDHAPQFELLRNPVLAGRCGECEFRLLCGGCRARPMSQSGQLMAEDPLCQYVPQNTLPIAAINTQEFADIVWSDKARHRLDKIPGFLQKMIKQRAEAYVSDLGEHCVTAEHLHLLAARRFGGTPAAFQKIAQPEDGQS